MCAIPMCIAVAKVERRKPRRLLLGCARFIEDKLFKTTMAPEEVAAIFVEPVQGEGKVSVGLLPPSS